MESLNYGLLVKHRHLWSENFKLCLQKSKIIPRCLINFIEFAGKQISGMKIVTIVAWLDKWSIVVWIVVYNNFHISFSIFIDANPSENKNRDLNWNFDLSFFANWESQFKFLCLLSKDNRVSKSIVFPSTLKLDRTAVNFTESM